MGTEDLVVGAASPVWGALLDAAAYLVEKYPKLADEDNPAPPPPPPPNGAKCPPVHRQISPRIPETAILLPKRPASEKPPPQPAPTRRTGRPYRAGHDQLRPAKCPGFIAAPVPRRPPLTPQNHPASARNPGLPQNNPLEFLEKTPYVG